jgi:hypothetical protein
LRQHLPGDHLLTNVGGTGLNHATHLEGQGRALAGATDAGKAQGVITAVLIYRSYPNGYALLTANGKQRIVFFCRSAAASYQDSGHSDCHESNSSK